MARSKQLERLINRVTAKTRLRATLDYQQDLVALEWIEAVDGRKEVVQVRSTDFDRLEWRGERGCVTSLQSGSGMTSIRAAIIALLRELPAQEMEIGAIYSDASERNWERPILQAGEDPWNYLIGGIHEYARQLDECWKHRRCTGITSGCESRKIRRAHGRCSVKFKRFARFGAAQLK